MVDRTVRIPGPDHPITIDPSESRVLVKLDGKIIADSSRALTLREAAYAPVYYIPREDVDMSQLQASDHTTYCPYKGDCTYYSIPGGGERSLNAVWTYASPFQAVAAIKGYLAFYPDRVDAIELRRL